MGIPDDLCVICHRRLERRSQRSGPDTIWFECDRCGRYATQYLGRLSLWYDGQVERPERQRALLSGFVRSRDLRGESAPTFAYGLRRPENSADSSHFTYVDEVLESVPVTLDDQAQETICNIACLGERGEWLKLNRETDLSVAFARDIDELDMLLGYMQDEGLLNYNLTDVHVLVQLRGKAWSSIDRRMQPPSSRDTPMSTSGNKVFIGHGGSKVWRDLKDFLQDRLRLDYDEFNREPAAGLSTKERLVAMLNSVSFAFLVLTAEDETAEGVKQARQNVVHEVGLFQGRLGFERAIILLEDGCAEFSNIVGVTQIRFPKGDILAKSEEVRRVLEREGIISTATVPAS